MRFAERHLPRVEGRWSGAVRARVEAVRTTAAAAAAHPVPVLAALAIAHWLGVLALALTTTRNGWLFFQGGDQIWYATSGWLLAHGDLAPTPTIGYGWSALLAPIMAVTGADFLGAMPAVAVLNLAVLAPLALLAVFGIAQRLAGTGFGLATATLWVAAPFLAIPFWRSDYHERFVDQFLPQALGLTAMADYPSMVLLLVAAFLLLRTLETSAWTDAAAAGLLVGFAVGMKPSNAVFLGALPLAFLAARRFAPLVPFAAGLVPGVLTLAIWKYRGVGHLPLFTFEEVRLASEPVVAAIGIEKYVEFDWRHLQEQGANLREYFWSARVLEWIPLAGVVAVARRSVPTAALLGTWFAAFLVVKGASPRASVATHSFFRFMMPAYPAYFLLAASIPLLVPGVARRLARSIPTTAARRLGVPLVAALTGALVLATVAVAVAQPLSSDAKAFRVDDILVPVDRRIDVRVTPEGESRIVRWSTRDWNANVYYRVYRTAAEGVDTDCSATTGASDCHLEMLLLDTTREPVFRDGSPPPGAEYRIGVGANWADDPALGDVFAISPPVPAG